MSVFGLPNVGGSCYFNASVQAILNLNYLMIDEKDEVVRELKRLVKGDISIPIIIQLLESKTNGLFKHISASFSHDVIFYFIDVIPIFKELTTTKMFSITTCLRCNVSNITQETFNLFPLYANSEIETENTFKEEFEKI